MVEEWKSVPGYEGLYEISNLGQVRSLGRCTPHGQTREQMTKRLNVEATSDDAVMRNVRPHLLKVSVNRGYRVAYLCRPGMRGKTQKLYIDRTVAALWPEFAASPIIERAKNSKESLRHKNTDLTDLPNEEWRDIVGYEGIYQVSNLGRVKSLARMVANRHDRQSYVRACIRQPNAGGTAGYPKVELAKDGVITTVAMHILVANAFIPNPLGLEFVHHKDEDKANPRADNLEWKSRGDNVRDWFERRNGDVVRRAADALGISIEDARKILFPSK